MRWANTALNKADYLSKEDNVPVKSKQLVRLINSLYKKPALRLARNLFGFCALRLAELTAISVENCKLKISNIKCRRVAEEYKRPDDLSTGDSKTR